MLAAPALLAQGAAVPTPPATDDGGSLDTVVPAHGARVAGNPVVPACPVHDVFGPGKALDLCVGADDHGAAVPAAPPGGGRAMVGVDEGGMFETREGGCDVECADIVGAGALGLRSQRKREPKGKCCTTGNLERTSALYILIIPWRASIWKPAVVDKYKKYLIDLSPASGHA